MPNKPLPWYCSRCKTATIMPRPQRYEFIKAYDGRKVPIVIENLPVPTCTKCGYQILDVGTLAVIDENTSEQLGLLSPREIRAARERLGFTQQEVQARLGLGGNTLSRWEKGHIFQSRAMDRFLRVFFASTQVQHMLETNEVSGCGSAPAEADRFSHRRSASSLRLRNASVRLVFHGALEAA